MTAPDNSEHERERAREYLDLLQAGYKADGIVGAMGRLSVPVGRQVAPTATLEQGLRIIAEELGHVLALLEERAEQARDDAGSDSFWMDRNT